MTPDVFSTSPTTYALAENVGYMLGLRSISITETLLATPALRHEIDAKLATLLGEVRPLLPDDARILWAVLTLTAQRRRQLARIATLLLNQPVVLATTNGELLAQAVEFSGVPSILTTLREMKMPKITTIPQLPILSLEALSAFTSKTLRLTLGLFPPSYLARIAMAEPRGSMPGIEVLELGTPGRAGFLQIIETATRLLARTGDEHASNQAV